MDSSNAASWGEEDRTHAALTQAADQVKTARKTRSEMGVDLSHSGKSSARRL